jgi:hypothetical protein
MIAPMRDQRPKRPTQDLFAAVPPPAVQKPVPKAEIESANPPPRYLLPKDLPSALRWLDDSEVKTLAAAVTNEAKRRGLLPPQDKTNTRRRPEHPPASEGSLALGKVNAVRAAFMAGVKPATIARQFGISQAAVKQVLAAETKRKS